MRQKCMVSPEDPQIWNLWRKSNMGIEKNNIPTPLTKCVKNALFGLKIRKYETSEGNRPWRLRKIASRHHLPNASKMHCLAWRSANMKLLKEIDHGDWEKWHPDATYQLRQKCMACLSSASMKPSEGNRPWRFRKITSRRHLPKSSKCMV